jgi:hypothetical protein
MPLPPLHAILLGAALPALAGPTAAADDPALVPACRALAAAVAPAPLVADLTAALAVHGGAVRWEPAEAARPLVVWLQPRPRRLAPTLHTEGEWRAALVDGVLAWSDVVSGLRVAVGRDSAAADVRVVWTATLPRAEAGDPAAGTLGAPTGITAGRTLLDPDDSGRAARATVLLAAAAGDGAPYQPRDVRAVARHEMGHVLGLAHHAAATSVMAPLVSAERIGDADRAVLRALYALPAGARCRR